MPPKGRRRPADEETSAATKDWGHPEGMQLADIDINAAYDGVVTNVGPYGVFINFGAVKDGLLKVPTKVGRGFKRGMEVANLSVLSCDTDSGRVVLVPQDDTVLPEPPPRQPRAKAQAKAKSKAKAKAKGGGAKDAASSGRSSNRKPRDWGHLDGTALEDISEGDVLDGVVTNVSPYGVFVNVGATKDARLSVPTKIGRRFRIGDTIPECKVESVNAETGRMTVVLDDAEEVVKDLPPKERKAAEPAPKAKAAAKAKSKSAPAAKAQPAPKAKSRAKKGPSTIERLRVGQVVDGVVSNKGKYGIFVDIGVGKDAKLEVPNKMLSQFRRNDEIVGMVVETVDLEKVQIAVSLEDPELTGGNEAPARSGSAAPKAKVAAKSKASPKAKPKAKQQQQEKDWSHENALPVSKFKVGQLADGRVTNVGPQGVFINIGAVRDGILKVPKGIAKQFRVGDEVLGMLIETVDAKAEKITMSLEDPELKDPGTDGGSSKQRNSRSPQAKAASQPSSKAKAKAKGKAEAQKGAPDWGHAGGIALEDLEVGAEVTGIVTNRGQFGVFLDIGAVKDGKLKLGRDEWRKFRKGDEVQEMVIDEVDIKAGQITLSLTYELGDEPEEIEESEPAPRPKAKTKAKAKGKQGSAAQAAGGRNQEAASSRSPARSPGSRPAQAKAKAGRGRG